MNKIISIIALLLILPIFKVEAYDFVIEKNMVRLKCLGFENF